MTPGRGDDEGLAAGGPARHVPVLLDAVIEALDPGPGLYLDATFGAGSYTRAILARSATRVLALDRDPDAIAIGAALAEEFGDRLILKQARFGDLDGVAAQLGLADFRELCSISVFPRCNSTRPDAGFRSASTVRSICGWNRRDPAPPISSITTMRSVSPIFFIITARSGTRGGLPAQS